MRYYMFNKPSGCVTACRDERHKTVMDYFADEAEGLFPIGRLDKDTEGLLLVTDDGMLSYNLMMPEKKVKKTYFLWARGVMSEEKRTELERGAAIFPGKDDITAPATVRVLERKTLGDVREYLPDGDRLSPRKAILPVFSALITITEGKKHQVKRMINYAGCKVLYLKRISIGGLSLDPSLPLGEYRSLTDRELKLLKDK